MGVKEAINSKWKYGNIHHWMLNHYGNATKCENKKCQSKNPKRYEWALRKGKQYERDRNNFIQLCPSCHRKYDYTEERRIKQSINSSRP